MRSILDVVLLALIILIIALIAVTCTPNSSTTSPGISGPLGTANAILSAIPNTERSNANSNTLEVAETSVLIAEGSRWFVIKAQDTPDSAIVEFREDISARIVRGFCISGNTLAVPYPNDEEKIWYVAGKGQLNILEPENSKYQVFQITEEIVSGNLKPVTNPTLTIVVSTATITPTLNAISSVASPEATAYVFDPSQNLTQTPFDIGLTGGKAVFSKRGIVYLLAVATLIILAAIIYLRFFRR